MYEINWNHTTWVPRPTPLTSFDIIVLLHSQLHPDHCHGHHGDQGLHCRLRHRHDNCQAFVVHVCSCTIDIGWFASDELSCLQFIVRDSWSMCELLKFCILLQQEYCTWTDVANGLNKEGYDRSRSRATSQITKRAVLKHLLNELRPEPCDRKIQANKYKHWQTG